MRSAVVAVVVIVIVVVGIIGYAFVGIAFASTRIANADRSLNTVISHQNNLNSTFKDIDKQFNGLSTTSAFNPAQSRTLIDKFIANARSAGTAVSQDDASLVSARAGLASHQWLTAFSRSGLDREAARIDHARKALSNAKSISADYVKDGEFFQAFLETMVDLEKFLNETGAGDLNAARASLPGMKAHVDNALQLSTGPGLPPEVHSLMVDFQGLVVDFGGLLDAIGTNDSAAIMNAGKKVEDDGTRIGTYDFTKIGIQIDAFYKPRVDAFNSEMAKATAA
ncbi:MAG: hypothetical protein PVS2B1_07340 [Candidatus Dormibacteraceae bacterium]